MGKIMIPTVSSLRATRRRQTRHVERLEIAEFVIREMRAGAVLHSEYTKQGTRWWLSNWLSNGTPIPDSIAKLVTGSSSVMPAGDCLFPDATASQTFRWWSDEFTTEETRT
jgi:hypothetical protein